MMLCICSVIQLSDCVVTQGLEGNEEWMGDEEEPLVGFSWRGGFERDTTGILMWSQPFIATLPSGEQVGMWLNPADSLKHFSS